MLRHVILTLLPLSLLPAGHPVRAFEIFSQGENFAITYDKTAQNVVGGGRVAVMQQGEGMNISYASDAPTQSGGFAQFIGQGESGSIGYLPASPARGSRPAAPLPPRG